MEKTYQNYAFSMGESPERMYKGIRAPISQGRDFAFKTLDDLVPIFISILDYSTSRGCEINEIELLTEIVKKVKFSDLMDKGNTILNHSGNQVFASEENKPDSFVLSNTKQFDDWFSQYPEDMIEFYAYLVWHNVSPFISSFMQKYRASMEESIAPQVTEKS